MRGLARDLGFAKSQLPKAKSESPDALLGPAGNWKPETRN
jgi:hypothetical protein